MSAGPANYDAALAKIRQARTNMILGQPFFGALVMRLKAVPDPSCKTLWTDGISMGFNPDYVAALPMPELEAGVAHEVLHVANGHTWRRGHRDPKRWNESADLAINPLLREAGFQIGKDWLCDDQYKGLSVEAIYERLPRGHEGGDGEGSGAGGSGGSSASEPSGTNSQPGQGDSSSGPGEVRDLPDPDRAAEVEADWKVAVKQAAQAAKMRGDLPGGLQWLVEDTTRNKTDWRSILHRFVQTAARNDYDWRKPNPRYMHMGLYLPALRSEEMGPIVVGVDTSGSTGEWMSTFFGELSSVVQDVRPERVHVIYVDARVQKVDEFGPDDELVLAPKGGGGTRFEPFFEYIEKNDIAPACAIYLTDLYGTFPEQAPGYPVLWAVPNEAKAPFGEVVRIED
ncbi:MAG: DUF2201 family putative metallopeptidase [Pseudomonadota bacterium]|jgi:predicted metal-dependent peptidase